MALGARPRLPAHGPVDEVATLSTDLKTLPVLRDAHGLEQAVAVAAACLSTTRFEAARRIA